MPLDFLTGEDLHGVHSVCGSHVNFEAHHQLEGFLFGAPSTSSSRVKGVTELTRTAFAEMGSPDFLFGGPCSSSGRAKGVTRLAPTAFPEVDSLVMNDLMKNPSKVLDLMKNPVMKGTLGFLMHGWPAVAQRNSQLMVGRYSIY